MGGINVARWLAGGVTAAVVTSVLEGIASLFYMDPMISSLEALGLTMEMTAVGWVLALLVSLIGGMVLIFFYAAARPRFGPGPQTAILVAIAMWFGGYLLSLVGYHMIGLYPLSMLVMWGAVGLVELILAALAGAWVYREG